MSGETPDLSGGIGGGAGSGGGSAAGGVGAGAAGAGGASAGAGGAGGFGGIAGSQVVPILIAGGLSGVIAMAALIATNVVPVHSGGSGASPRGLVLVACPDSGPVLAVVDPGQKLLVTGRSSDGSWLQVYLPGPALPYAWAPAAELQPSGDTGTLPVASCEVAAASPSATPIVAVVSPTPTATPTPTPTPIPTPTPVATPTNSSPIIANLAASPGTIYYSWSSASGPSCGPDAKDPDTATVSAQITDPQGVASATLFYRLPSGSYSSKAMTKSGSTYSATVKAPNGYNHTGNLDYYVVSKDGSAAGKTRTSPLKAVVVKKCDIPPSVTDYTVKPMSIYVPLKKVTVGVPGCSQFGGNTISVNGYAVDSDGSIANIVFWYTPYGTTTRKSLTLTKSSLSSAYGGKLTNTKFAKLASVGPHDFAAYLVATDNAGRDSARYPISGLTEIGCSPS